jgi:hypothetical protein
MIREHASLTDDSYRHARLAQIANLGGERRSNP